MGSTTVLNQVRVAAPCNAAWSAMAGDERVRFCGLCEKHVYNLSALSADEATALVERAEGKMCVRFYQRRDGTMMTADCPVGASAAAHGRVRRFAIWASLGVVVAISGLLVQARGGIGTREPLTPPPTGPGVTLGDWTDWALESLGIRRRRAIAGGMRICPMPPPVPTSPSLTPGPPPTP